MRSLPLLLALPLGLAACSSSSSPATTTTTTSSTATTTTTTGGGGGAGGGAGGSAAGGAGGSAAGGAGGGAAALCTTPTDVPCSDQVVVGMNLQSVVTKGGITNDADGAGFRSHVDATAGGAFVSKPESYTYAKFTDKGLEKVDLGDDKALESMDWDIAFRRYVLRVNSKYSGPSCVQAARVPGAKYEDVASLPDKLTYHVDDYFTDSPDCSLIPDGSGLPGSPATALSSYWTYDSCVKMTNNVFVIALADGQHVKFQVESYYAPAVQTECDTKGTIPQSGTGSANFVVRWAYLP
jgi:hypothetical protein